MFEIIILDDATKEKIIRRVADGAIIPKDPGNRDFQEFLAWNLQQQTPLIWE